jgi:hypothetical protein
MRSLRLLSITSLAPAALAIGLLGAAGCSNKEKVLDVETPRGQVEVTRDRDTGEVNVDATKKKTILNVDTPGANVEVKRDANSGSIDVDTTSK